MDDRKNRLNIAARVQIIFIFIASPPEFFLLTVCRVAAPVKRK